MAGLQTMPVMIRDAVAVRVQVLQLTENLQRQDLEPLEEARGYKALMDVEDLSPPQLANRLHITAQHVRDRLRLLDDQVLADAVVRRQIAASVARAIQQLPDEQYAHFRARVQAGEHLRGSDLAQARAQLAARGYVNPRLDRRFTMSSPPEMNERDSRIVGLEEAHAGDMSSLMNTRARMLPTKPRGQVIADLMQTVFASESMQSELPARTRVPGVAVPLTVQRWHERAGRLEEDELTDLLLADLLRLHPHADLPGLRALLSARPGE